MIKSPVTVKTWAAGLVSASVFGMFGSDIMTFTIPWARACCSLLINLSIGMWQARRGLTGIMNYTNPGAISHNEIMELYKQYIDSEFTWSNFNIEEQAKVIKAPRSNNLLDTKRVMHHLCCCLCLCACACKHVQARAYGSVPVGVGASGHPCMHHLGVVIWNNHCQSPLELTLTSGFVQ